MNIQPLVEGRGEVASVAMLLRRLRDAAGVFEVDVNEPIRRAKSDFVTEGSLRAAVRLALKQASCGAVLILFDGDKDCPKDLVPRIFAWATAEAHGLPCAIVLAVREYEAWFLGAIESLRGKHSRCRSFRKLVKAFGELAAGLGYPIDIWPPADWDEH